MPSRWVLLGIGLACGFTLSSGCSCSIQPPSKSSLVTNGDTPSGDQEAPKAPDSEASAKTKEPPKEFKFGDLLEPFTPPKLEELDKTAQWADRPIVNPLQLLRETQAKEQPLVP